MKPTAEIAVNRFGTGARPGDLEAAGADPQAYLRRQLDQTKVFGFKPAPVQSRQALVQLRDFRELKKTTDALRRQSGEAPAMQAMAANPMVADSANDPLKKEKQLRRKISREAEALAADTLVQLVHSDNGLQSRLLDFFSNHFSVSATNLPMRALAPTLEREAIAPHLTGRFEDMLLAVEQHPAMLFYLNNEQSVGPDSRVGQRRKGRGLNENLAREILELHTLGVDGGYTQGDVRELAMAITGWSVHNKANQQGFVFRKAAHQPGGRTLLGKNYPQQGIYQGAAMLQTLARHPSTARYVSFKLARHFIADQPPEVLVDAMSQRWLATKGNLKQVMQAMIEHPLSWQPEQKKLKTPREFLVSSLRTGAVPLPKVNGLKDSLQALGQLPFSAGSPAGFGDTTDTWQGSNTLMRRAEWSYEMAGRLSGKIRRAGKQAVAELAQEILGKQLRADTLGLIKRSDQPRQAMALLLMSPEFQRR